MSKHHKCANVQDKVARICWNTNGWHLPSGPEGKSKNKKVYECKECFGHEEWLFNQNMEIDGYCYAFLQPFNKKCHEGAIYNLHLFARKSNGDYYYINNIKSIECISKEVSEEIHKKCKNELWYKEIREAIKNKKGNPDKIYDKRLIKFVNVRFKKENIIPCSPNLKIDPANKNIQCNRYMLFNKKEDFTFL